MSWLQICQSKPMALPFKARDKINTKAVPPFGNFRIDGIMPEEVAQLEEMAFPNMQYLDAGNIGTAYENYPYVVKYTDDFREANVARQQMIHPIPCMVKIFSVEEIPAINDNTLFRIVQEKVDTSQMRSGKPRPKQGIGIHLDIHDSTTPLGKEYDALCECLRQAGYNTSDAHERNIGRNKEGRLVLFDLGNTTFD